MVDVVDEEDRVVGVTPRADMRGLNLPHRTAYVLCRNSGGDVFVHLRTATKDVYPSMYDAFFGGVAASGEPIEQTAHREFAEEAGVEGAELRFCFKEFFEDDRSRQWASIYETSWDGPLVLQVEEVESGEWVALEKMVGLMNERPFVPDGRALFLMWLGQHAARHD